MRLIHRAYHAEGDRKRQVRRLALAVDDAKGLIQVAKELGACANFNAYGVGVNLTPLPAMASL